MSHPGKSVFLFGLYMLLLGAALVLAPNLLLPLFGFALTDEVWIRVMGQLALYLGCITSGPATPGGVSSWP
ncbi:hypothetical protein TRE132_52680 [Pseudomonas chlororaphis subsp. aurantiaca]|nr:hypothetical protein TRE132_52680 [Pseudomonas chlororaphis subsp. aurantiaca]